MTAEHADPITLHTSWRGVVTTIIGSAIVAILGVWAFTGRGFDAMSVGLLTAAVILSGVALFDYPHRSTFAADGIHRHCVLRHHILEWEAVTAIVRPAGARGSGKRSGLTAQRGRRHYLLCDQAESQAEYNEIRTALASWVGGVEVRARPPAEDTAPTWLYKRKPDAIGPGRVDRSGPGRP